MTPSNHTPGPWSASPPSSVVGIAVTAPGPFPLIASVPSGVANARLIAAAPDLLEAMKNLIDAHRKVVHGEATHVPASLLHAGEAAIAKAEGKP